MNKGFITIGIEYGEDEGQCETFEVSAESVQWLQLMDWDDKHLELSNMLNALSERARGSIQRQRGRRPSPANLHPEH